MNYYFEDSNWTICCVDDVDFMITMRKIIRNNEPIWWAYINRFMNAFVFFFLRWSKLINWFLNFTDANELTDALKTKNETESYRFKATKQTARYFVAIDTLLTNHHVADFSNFRTLTNIFIFTTTWLLRCWRVNCKII